MAEDKQLKAARLVNAGGLQQVAQGVLTAAKEHAQGAANAVDTKLTNEVTRAKGVEEGLQGAITALEKKVGNGTVGADVETLKGQMATAQGDIEQLEKDLAQEVTDRQGAVQGVQGALDAEIERAGAKEEELAGAIADEKERAEGEEAAIRSEFAAADAVVLTGAKEHAQGLVDTEKGLREAAETQIRADYAAADIQVLSDAKAHAQGLVNTEKGLREAAETQIRADYAAADTALENKINAKIAADILAETNRADAEEKAIRKAFADADAALKTALQKEIDDDITAERAVREAAESKIREDYVAADAEVLSGAKAHAQTLVDGEKERAEAAEAGLDARIAKMEGEGGAIASAIAEAKAYTDELANGQVATNKTDIAANKSAIEKEVEDRATAVQTEQQRAMGVESGLDGRLKTAEANIIQHGKDITQTLTDAKSHAQGLVDGEKGLREAADAGLQSQITTNAQAIEKLNGNEEVVGSVAQKIKAAIDKVNGTAAELELRVKANEDALDGLEKGTVQASIDQAEADAKKHAEDKVQDLAEGQVATNTAAIAANGQAIAANAAAIATLNGAATVEGSVAKQVSDAIAGVVANAPEDLNTLKEIADYIASDKTGAAELSNRVAANETAIGVLNGADSVEGSVKQQIKVERERAELAEQNLGGRVDGVIADLAAEKLALQKEIDADVKAEADRAVAAENAIKGRLDVIEGADNVEGSIAKAVKDESILRANKDTELQTAIEKEVTDRQEAINTLSGQVAATFNLLNVEVTEGGMIQVYLDDKGMSGVDGPKPTVLGETAIPVMDQDDIDAIINGLV